MDSFFELLNNAALMLVLCVIYDTFGIHAIAKKNLQYCVTGVLVGFIGIIVMLNPWSLQPGVFFDTRWVLLSLCGLFFGLTPTAIAVIITGSFRLYQGGAGGIVGTVVIVVTACLGLAWRYWNAKYDKPLGWKQLYAFGVLVQLAMLSCMALMPADMRIPIIKAIALPILIIYPVLTMLIGLVLKKQEDRRNAEKELMENRRALSNERGLLRGVINSIPDLIFFKNTKGTYLGCNKPFESFVGTDEQSLLGKTDFDVFDRRTAEFLQKEDDHMFAINKPIINEKWVNYPDGKKALLSTLKTPFKDLDGTLQGLVGISRDITERRQAQEEKIHAQAIAVDREKLALVGQIAGKMAHDFNNILGIIMGNTELSLLDCREAETRKTLELILVQTIRGKNLTKNLIAFAKDQEPRQEFFRISEKIDLVVNLMKKDLEGIEIIKEDSPGVPELLADPGMIEHALVNLIQNSIHATSMNKSPQIFIRTYCPGENICFEVEDNGCGIPKECLENIFEPFFTLKGTKDVTGSYEIGIKGTGYGMANVKKYIEQHKGKVSVASEFGSGTKFIISLPVIKKELTVEEKSKIRDEITHFEKYILLVEDETAIAGVQYRLLTQDPCNHKVDMANKGQVAIDLFNRNKYDLISLDYVLPGKMNGMDVYNHIRKTNKTTPILFVSGNIEFLESIKALKQKDINIDHISKPCQNKDYVNAVNELFEKPLTK